MHTQTPGGDYASPPFDHARASAAGWDVFDCGQRPNGVTHVELQRVDAPEGRDPLFENDEAVWRHVAAKALTGSARHLEALDRIDPLERKLIEHTLGYRLPRSQEAGQ